MALNSRFAIVVAAAIAASCAPAPPNEARPVQAQPVETPPPRREPNTGTAPDWINVCMGRARGEFRVSHDAIRLTRTEARPGGGFTATGTADRGAAGIARFRCETNPDDSLRLFERL